MKEKIYQLLPIFIQNIAISIFGFFWKKRRFGGVFKRELIEFNARTKYNSEQWDKYLNEQLRKLLVHAIKTVPFYINSFKEHGIELNDVESFTLADLNKLPFLEKRQLREHCKSSLMSNDTDKDGGYFTTSGSTGTPTSIYYSKFQHQRYSAAFEIRGRNFAGIDNSMRRGMIGGRNVVHSSQKLPPFYRYNFFEKQVYFSITHLRKENAHNYVAAINKYKIDYMTGYTISNFLLAKYIEDLGLKVKPLKAVLTSSEKLSQEMRDTFERVYKCKTYDGYGSVEMCAMVTNCEFGSYHISPDVGIIELINEDGQPALPGELAEIICTGLLNFNQPLIRYRIGDLAILAKNQQCECGLNLPIIEEIVGRIDDIVTLSDGRQIASFNRFFANLSGIEEVQVVQEDFDKFILNLVPGSNYNEETKHEILKSFNTKLGNVEVEINLVERIEKGPNGKFKAVISKVKLK